MTTKWMDELERRVERIAAEMRRRQEIEDQAFLPAPEVRTAETAVNNVEERGGERHAG